MPETLRRVHGIDVLLCAPDGATVAAERDAVDLIGEAMQHWASMVLIPVERLSDDFFQLSTRVAGDIVQKFVTYRLRLVIVGDIAQHVARSAALSDFVSETNRGDQVWFMATLAELDERLNA
jgi:hypothetical protein